MPGVARTQPSQNPDDVLRTGPNASGPNASDLRSRRPHGPGDGLPRTGEITVRPGPTLVMLEAYELLGTDVGRWRFPSRSRRSDRSRTWGLTTGAVRPRVDTGVDVRPGVVPLLVE